MERNGMDEGQGRTPPRLAQLPTGIAGVDAVLRGGIPAGSVVLVAGSPGTGKTTLGNQLAHVHAAGGGRAVFATAMAETHDRMLAHLAGFGFYDPARVGRGSPI
jgi:circadian clock protein KaiC